MSPLDLILRAETLLLDVRLNDDDWQSSRDKWCRDVAILYGNRTRIDELTAELAEAKLQRDSWKRIAESGLGLTEETGAGK